MARVFVFDDGARRAAIVTLDLLFLNTATVAEFRAAIVPGTGLAAENVLIACSHTHWGPHTAAIMDEDADFAYLDFVRARLVEAAAQAVRALQPARLKAARIQAPGWAFNRRPIYRTARASRLAPRARSGSRILCAWKARTIPNWVSCWLKTWQASPWAGW